MKKIIFITSVLLLICTFSFAFLYGVKVLTQEEIKELTDEELYEVYVDSKIEEKASGEFHKSAGFSSAKDYNKRKRMLRFIFDLRKEVDTRASFDVESIDRYLE